MSNSVKPKALRYLFRYM